MLFSSTIEASSDRVERARFAPLRLSELDLAEILRNLQACSNKGRLRPPPRHSSTRIVLSLNIVPSWVAGVPLQCSRHAEASVKTLLRNTCRFDDDDVAAFEGLLEERRAAVGPEGLLVVLYIQNWFIDVVNYQDFA